MSRRFAAAVNTLRGMVVSPNPIIGPTEQSTIDALSADYAPFQPEFFNDQTFETDLQFPKSAEGEVYVMRIQGKNKRFVRKHTRSTSRIDCDVPLGALPNEAQILRSRLRPHPRIVSLYASIQDREDPTRFNLWMKCCNGGHAV